MLNATQLQGRICNDLELRHTPNDTAVTSFTIACDRPKSGAEKQTDFFDCVAWRGTAEFLCKYFTRGSLIAVEGSLQTRTYTDKQGNNRKVTEIVVNQAHFCEGKKDKPAESDTTGAQETFNGNVQDFEEVADDEELPFNK